MNNCRNEDNEITFVVESYTLADSRSGYEVLSVARANQMNRAIDKFLASRGKKYTALQIHNHQNKKAFLKKPKK